MKKGKKDPRGRQRDRPWPPRTDPDPASSKETEHILKTVSQKLARMHKARRVDPLPTIPEDHEPGAITAEGFDYKASSVNGDRDQDHVLSPDAPGVLGASPLCSPQMASNEPTAGSRSPDVPSAMGSNTNDTKEHVIDIHNEPVETALSPPDPRANAAQEVGHHDTEVMAPARPKAHSAESQAQLRNRLGQDAATPRGASHRAAPHRVEKSQKHRRPSRLTQQSSTSALLRFQGSSKQLSFEQTWDMLRAAHHADLTQKDHDVAKQAEHFEEVKTLLRGQINQYSMNLAEEKSQHGILKTYMSNLREKARTNQKFAAGLEKDYEKLKKLTIDCQEECKKTLQQKTWELEYEKESLRREVSSILDNVAKGHKKLKSTANELYLRLEFSEAKRMTLAEQLTKQTALYAEEKAIRNNLEGRLLSLGPSSTLR